MNTLTLDQLATETTRLKASFGGHFPTSIIELKAVPRMIAAFDSETEDLAGRVAENERDVEMLEKEISEDNKQIAKLEADIERLKCLLSEKEDGKTIMDWKRETEEAKAEAKQSRSNARDWQDELTAMRKRKGVQAGVFAHWGAIHRFLSSLSKPGFYASTVASQESAKLLSAIESTK